MTDVRSTAPTATVRGEREPVQTELVRVVVGDAAMTGSGLAFGSVVWRLRSSRICCTLAPWCTNASGVYPISRYHLLT